MVRICPRPCDLVIQQCNGNIQRKKNEKRTKKGIREQERKQSSTPIANKRKRKKKKKKEKEKRKRKRTKRTSFLGRLSYTTVVLLRKEREESKS